MYKLKASFLCLALAACSSDGPRVGQPIEQTSATAENKVVRVRTALLRIQYDPAAVPTAAILTYAEEPGISDLLFINREVFPAVQNTTGCRITAPPVAENQLLGSEGRTTVPLAC